MRLRLSVVVLLISALPALAQDGKQKTERSEVESSHAGGVSTTSFFGGIPPITGQRVTCTGGKAAGLSCRNVDLLSFLPIESIGGTASTRLNDIWGWTDPLTGKEYALVGRTDGTAFVDITDPINPVYIGSLPLTPGASPTTWRDLKVHKNHVYVVSDNSVNGMQVFDLARLRSPLAAPRTFEADTVYMGFRRAHNIAINEETEFAYAVGTETCGGGLHMMDISNPRQPTFVGCYNEPLTGRGGTGYTHDTQCVVYHGPDSAYREREICVSSNETAVVVTDVTDKSAPETIGIANYPSAFYTHQGWLTPDHQYFLLDDELDERGDPAIDRTRTLIWDFRSLEDPQLIKQYLGSTTSIDHNQYVVGQRVFQANYTSGLRILDIADIRNPSEVGFFDTYTPNDALDFLGAWSNYPFFESGSIIVSSMTEGLFVLRPTGPAKTSSAEEELPSEFRLLTAYPNPFNPQTTITLEVDRPQNVRISVHDVQGKEVAVLFAGAVQAPGRQDLAFDARGMASGVYLVRATGESATHTISITLQK